MKSSSLISSYTSLLLNAFWTCLSFSSVKSHFKSHFTFSGNVRPLSSKLWMMCITTFSCKLWRYPVKVACFTHCAFNICCLLIISVLLNSPSPYSHQSPKQYVAYDLPVVNILTGSIILSCSSHHRSSKKISLYILVQTILWHRLQYRFWKKKKVHCNIWKISRSLKEVGLDIFPHPPVNLAIISLTIYQ